MSIPAKYLKPPQRDELFQQIIRLLPEKLPVDLREIDIKYNSKEMENFIKFYYPELKATGCNARYELQFASTSPTHEKHFKEKRPIVLAFYVDSWLKKREDWIEAMKSYVDSITQQLQLPVKFGHWNENWAWLGVNLNNKNLGSDPDRFSEAIAEFIQVTYTPISKALQVIDG